MKKAAVKTISLVCALTIAMTLMAGCGGKTETKNEGQNSQTASAAPAKQAEPAKLTYMSGNGGRNLKEDNPVVKEIEKKTNTVLEVNLVPDAEFTNKFNIMVASSDIPDIVRIGGYNCFQYIPQGVFAELDSLIEKNGANLKKNIPAEAWEMIKFNKKTYTVPGFNSPGKYNYVIRQDWLDNLGIKAPTTLDEMTEMLKKFTYNDPDKNGKNDTYGYSLDSDFTFNTLGVIFGAFGAIPGQFYEKNGKAVAASILPEYKEAVEYITKLYNVEKVIEPDFFLLKRDQARQYLVQGRAGSLTAWWSLTPQVFMEQMKMKEVNPKAEWMISPPIKGKNGQYGFPGNGIVSGSTGVSAKSKNPDAAVKLLDFLASDEGAKLSTWGLKDVHYTEKDGKFEKRTDEGNKAFNEKWLDYMGQVVIRMDLTFEMYRANNPTYVPYLESAMNAKLYNTLFEGITTSEAQKYLAELTKVEIDWFVKFVTGKEPISKWDEYVKQWNEKGGKEIMESYIKEYNKRKGTNLTAGN